MGWERRGNKCFYYQARRVNGRVVKEYVPPLLAELIALIDSDRQTMRQEAADELKAQRAALDELEASLKPLNDLADTLARGGMLAAGYHQHKGQWRKRRG
jgi:hypothetical protein